MILLVMLWYGATALESWLMGVHPLARRAFTAFDMGLFVFVICGCVILKVWSGRKQERLSDGTKKAL